MSIPFADLNAYGRLVKYVIQHRAYLNAYVVLSSASHYFTPTPKANTAYTGCDALNDE